MARSQRLIERDFIINVFILMTLLVIMFLVFEPICRGMEHVPFNAGLLR
jgi:hypothetical protein